MVELYCFCAISLIAQQVGCWQNLYKENCGCFMEMHTRIILQIINHIYSMSYLAHLQNHDRSGQILALPLGKYNYCMSNVAKLMHVKSLLLLQW